MEEVFFFSRGGVTIFKCMLKISSLFQSSSLRSPNPLQSVEGEHHEKAVELLKAAKDSVKLVVRYTPKVLEEMEARFEKLRTARRRQQQQLLMQQQQQQNLTSQQNHMS